MSIYDVFSGGSKPFDKAQWAAQKQEQRKEAYDRQYLYQNDDQRKLFPAVSGCAEPF